MVQNSNSVTSQDTCKQTDGEFGINMEELFKLHGLSTKLPVSCDFCEESFNDFDRFDEHMASHEESAFFPCQLCSNSYVSWSNLVAHRKACHKGEVLSCDNCSERTMHSMKVVNYKVGGFAYGCEECEEGFNDTVALYKHYRRHNDELLGGTDEGSVDKARKKEAEENRISELTVSYSKCKESFPSESLLKKHMQNLEGKDAFVCYTCDRRFCTARKLAFHKMKIHLKKGKRFVCMVCGLVFPDRAGLVAHKKTHPHFECEICRKKFATKIYLEYHKYQHPIKLQYQCIKCAKCFDEWLEFTQHIDSHCNERKLVCDICGEERDFVEFLSHYKECHAKKLEELVRKRKEKVTCKLCRKSFNHPLALSTHRKLHNYSEQKFYQCDLCEVRIVKEALFLEHITNHFPAGNIPEKYKNTSFFVQKNKAKPLICEYCARGFSRTSSLKIHLKLHEENKFQCSQCYQVFAKRLALKKHMNMHSTRKLHVCEFCKKKFKTLKSLTKHKQLAHSNDTSQSCTPNEMNVTCQALIVRESVSSEHQEMHSSADDMIMYVCTVCRMTFSSRSEYNSHAKEHSSSISTSSEIIVRQYSNRRLEGTQQQLESCDLFKLAGEDFGDMSELDIPVHNQADISDNFNM